MKKALALILSFAVVLTLAACGGGMASLPEPVHQSVTPQTAQPSIARIPNGFP